MSSPRPKKTRMQRSQMKVMLITFFDHQGMVHHEFVPQGQTVIQHFFKEVPTRLVNKIRQKRRASWGRKNLDLASRQCSCPHSVKQFLVSKEITMLHHPPYLPNLAPCDFFLFPKLKWILKGTHFQGVEDIKTSMTRHLKTITKDEFSECFKAWSKRMEKCIKANGEYFEGDK